MPSSESIVCVCPSVVVTDIAVQGSVIMGISVSTVHTMPNGDVCSVINWVWQMYIGGWAPSSRCRRLCLFPAFAKASALAQCPQGLSGQACGDEYGFQAAYEMPCRPRFKPSCRPHALCGSVLLPALSNAPTSALILL